MSEKLIPQPDPIQRMIDQIMVNRPLDSQWANWSGGLTITLEEDGITLLTGLVIDKAALHGLLKRVRDLGLPLLSVNFVNTDLARP